MKKIVFEHGGKKYDEKYPEGIPSSLEIVLTGINFESFTDGTKLSSGFVMFPSGHALNT